MPQRNLVLFDLEWNIGYQPYPFNYHGVQQTFRGEIIEIGAVKIDEDANVLDTFSIHLRPRIFRKLQHHIAKVTGLTQADLDRGEPIVQGLRRFMKWCGPDAEFAEWGMDDVPVLKQNLFLCNLDESRPTVWYDLQQVFLREHPRKEGEGMTLESVVTRMGIPMDRPFHDALSDTLYTADVCRKLDLRAGLAAYPTEDEALHQSLCPAPGDYRDFKVFRGYVEPSTWRTGPRHQRGAVPGVRRRSDPGRDLAEKGQQQLVYAGPVPPLPGQRQRGRQGRPAAVQAGPAGRPALELCPLRAGAGRRGPGPLAQAAHPADRADACPGRKAGGRSRQKRREIRKILQENPPFFRNKRRGRVQKGKKRSNSVHSPVIEFGYTSCIECARRERMNA